MLSLNYALPISPAMWHGSSEKPEGRLRPAVGWGLVQPGTCFEPEMPVMRIVEKGLNMKSSTLHDGIFFIAGLVVAMCMSGSAVAQEATIGKILSAPTSVTGRPRSEEHTSELQSLMRISYAVFCLKKKKRHKRQISA